MYEIRKSIGGWSVDQKVNNCWMFVAKFSTKKEALNYIKLKEV